MKILNLFSKVNADSPLLNRRELSSQLLDKTNLRSATAEEIRYLNTLITAFANPLSPSKILRSQGLEVSYDETSFHFGPFGSWEEKEDFREAWAKNARDSWWPALLDIFKSLSSPEITIQWRTEMILLISEWLREKPQFWSDLLLLGQKKELRSYVLEVFCAGANQSAEKVGVIPLLTPFLEQLDQLTEDEILDLVNGLGDIGSDNAKEIIHFIDVSLPLNMQRAKKEIRIYD